MSKKGKGFVISRKKLSTKKDEKISVEKIFSKANWHLARIVNGREILPGEEMEYRKKKLVLIKTLFSSMSNLPSENKRAYGVLMNKLNDGMQKKLDNTLVEKN